MVRRSFLGLTNLPRASQFPELCSDLVETQQTKGAVSYGPFKHAFGLTIVPFGAPPCRDLQMFPDLPSET